jgi:hypothetical protein
LIVSKKKGYLTSANSLVQSSYNQFVSASLLPERRESLKALLLKYADCFAWSYEEMPGLDPHKLKIDPNVQPVKQAPRRMRIELEEKVVIETKKLIEAGFIQEE